MTLWTVDLNSFEVETETKEEAIKKAAEKLKKDISLAMPFNVFESK